MRLIIKISTMITAATLFTCAQTYAFGLGDIAKRVAEKVAVEKAVEKTSEVLSGDGGAKQDDTSIPPQQLDTAAPIAEAPFAITLKANRGSAKVFAKRPKIALAGYNIAAFQTAKISGFTSRGQGASASMSFILEGVDATMLQRIADAAHSDLVAQLQAANIEVIDAPTLFKSPESDEIKRSSEPVNGKQMDGRAPKKLLMVGPSNVGSVGIFSMVPKGFNGNVGDQASAALDAIVIYPNLGFDFAWTGGGGRSMLKNKASVEGGARFALDSISNFYGVYSKDGRFVDDAIQLIPGDDVGVPDVFASVEQAGSRNNGGAVAISNTLGVGMSSNKGSDYVVYADAKRYETLALNAAKGFNAALVQQIKAAKGL